MKNTLAVAFAFLVPVLHAQDSPRAEVLVLGTYHMANPGHDIFNTNADDVLAPKRQVEIAQLIDVLKKFNPTKIAIEADVYDSRRPKEYADYLAGRHELTRNEIEQIGFRLAKELGHKTIYPVDVDVDFPYQHLVNFAKAAGKSKDLDAMMSDTGAMVKEDNDYLASHSVLDTLLRINSDESVVRSMMFYSRAAHFGQPGDWAGADLDANWYLRNMRIFTNVLHLADSPSDRILVIYGSGHLGWLRFDVLADPTLRLRKLSEFAK